MPLTSYLSSNYFQYWREALDEELRMEVDRANKYTKGSPWRVRMEVRAVRLKWWHWWKTTIYAYQVLNHIEADEYQVINLGEFLLWNARGVVFSYFLGFNAALSVALNQTFFSEAPTRKEST